MRQRSHHLATSLAQFADLVYINPCYYSAAGYLRDLAHGALTRDSIFGIKQVNAALHVATLPPLLPKGLDFPFIGRLNYSLLLPLLRRILAKLDMRAPVLWLSLPPDRALIGKLTERLVVYDCMDRHSAFRSGAAAKRLAHEEERLLHEADVVFASSQDLLEHCSNYNENVYLVRNGVDPEWFRAQAQNAFPSELALNVGGPTIGYVGTIGPWVDIELLREIATSFPSIALLLIGPEEADLSMLEGLPNVIITGQIPYQIVPMIIRHLDVCLLPFKISSLTRAVNPIKLYEYFSLGKPVVSTSLPEVELYDDICYVADTKESFIVGVREALREGNASDRVRERKRVADENSWARRVEEIIRILDSHL